MSTVEIDLPGYAKLVYKIGRPVVLAVALLMSIPGEIHLAEVAGWGPFTFFGVLTVNMANFMPVCVSVYAACSAVIADVAKRQKLPNRKSAVAGAVVALALALAAQDISHLIALDYMHTGWLLTAATSAVPPLVAFHMLHMAAAPAVTASVATVDAPEPEDDFEAGDDVANKPKGRRGRKGLSKDEVLAAVERLRAAGDSVTPANLADVMGRSVRTARRYMTVAKEAEKELTGMLPLGN